MDFKENDILVCEKTQRYGCGALLIRKGAIVKCAGDYYQLGLIYVYRDIHSEKANKKFVINIKNMRTATDPEVELYWKGVKTC